MSTPATLAILETEIESGYISAVINKAGLTELEIGFARTAVLNAVKSSGSGPVDITVRGYLATRQPFVGTGTVRILNRRLELVSALCTHWLQTGCDAPDWCEGLDLDHSGVVNFADFALVDRCPIEIVSP
jgi:hypothetical protein